MCVGGGVAPEHPAPAQAAKTGTPLHLARDDADMGRSSTSTAPAWRRAAMCSTPQARRWLHQPTLRHAFALLFGAGGLALSLSALRGPDACASALCVERITLAAAGIISSWCVCAALHELCNAGGDAAGQQDQKPQQLQQIPPPQHSCFAALVLIRALACGVVVALLGWSSASTGRPHILLMTMMQCSATVGAWSAFVSQREPHGPRSKSPQPEEEDEEAGRGGGGGGVNAAAAKYATPPKCRKSMTLPRGWRYHARDGVFEHKRSGRVQREPPLEAGSPLCADLPPIADEESRGLLNCRDRGYSSDSDGAEGGMSRGRRRSRTWGAASSPRGTPMSVWELRDALGGSHGRDHGHKKRG